MRSTDSRTKIIFLKVLKYILIFPQHIINSFYKKEFMNIFEAKSMCDTESTYKQNVELVFVEEVNSIL